MIVFDIECGGLYDKDEQTGKITKVLRLFTSDDGVKFSRFNYAENGTYVKATAEQLRKFQCTYYLENGTRPLKCIDCEKCFKAEGCNHHQRYYQ